MPKSIQFQGINANGNPVQITVTSEQQLDSSSQTSLALRQIAQTAARNTKDPQISVAVKQSDNSLFYSVGGKHQQIDKGQALEKDGAEVRLTTEPSLDSLLDRFSIEKPQPQSLSEKISQVLNPIFEALRSIYQYISQIWGGISRSEEKLRFDLALLHEVCGSPVPGAITQLQALRYLDGMMQRERAELYNPSLHQNIQGAIELMEKIARLRKGKERPFKELVNLVQQRICEQELFFLPVGFKDEQMLLGIQKQKNGSYTLNLCSSSEKVRDYFDHERDDNGVKQSTSRIIINVQQNDLLAAVPTLLELQAAKEDGSADIFFRTLHFPGSTVVKSELTETIAHGQVQGHLGSMLSNIACNSKGKQIDLALRLRTFLDLCKGSPERLKDIRFWTLARTTALQLAHLIENEKQLLGSESEQGQELTRIYYELKGVVDALEASPPVLSSSTSAAHFSCDIAFEKEPESPPLKFLQRTPTIHAEIDPPFMALDLKQPLVSMKNWRMRLEKLLQLNETVRAGREATLIVRSLPSPRDPFWRKASAQEAKETLAILSMIGKVIERGAKTKAQASLLDLASLTALNYYALPLVQKISPNDGKNHLYRAQIIMEELFQSNIGMTEKNWLKSIYAAFSKPTNDPKKNGWHSDILSLVDSLEGVAGNLLQEDRLPLPLRAPPYAAALLRESSNAGLIEYCPFGCGRDDHYERAHGSSKHDYPTVYLLNNHDVFNPQALMKEGTLHRDEAAALLYLQQTNQNPLSFHDKTSRSTQPLSHHFDANDRRIQAMNALSLYFDHPHFFKHPALRWLFESKLFNYEAFSSLLERGSFSLNQPFLRGLLNRLSQEMLLAYKMNDLGVASYLLSVAAEIRDLIQASDLTQEQQQKLDTFDSDKLFFSWAKELIGQSDESAREQQKILFPLFLARFFKKLCQNNQDAFFEKSENLELILCMVGRIESSLRGQERIDLELKEKYLTLLQHLTPKIRAHLAKDPDFINRVLFSLNPQVAARSLKWNAQDFPTLLARDDDGKSYQFDLLTGIMSFGKERIEPLPDNLKWHPDVQRLFPDREGDWHVSGVQDGSIVAYTSPNYPNRRILIKTREDIPGAFQRQSKIVIEKQIQGRWLHYVRFNAQNCLEQGKGYPLNADLPVQVAFAIGNSACWVDRNKQRILVQEEGEKDPSAILSLGSHSWQDSLTSVFFPTQKTYLLNPSRESLAPFTAIEDPAYLQMRGHRNAPSSVHYMRYELASTGSMLSYKIEQNKIISMTFPHFILQSFGERPGSSDPSIGALPLPRAFDQFHLLKYDGKEKVLIPMRHLKNLTTLAGENLAQSTFDFPKTTTRLPIYDYTVDPETNRLVATSGEAYAYLAYIALAHWDYEGSEFYLKKASITTGFTERHQTICSWIRELKNSSPNAIALQLRVELLHPAKDEERKAQLLRIAALYDRYNKATERDSTLALSSREEEAAVSSVRELLKEWGNSDEVTPIFARAQAATLPTFGGEDPVDLLKLPRSVKMIWQECGNETDLSLRSFQDPNWCLRNFRNLYNRILALPADSVELRQLENQLRLQNHHSSIQNALLKMISAKKKNSLPSALKPLSKIKGHFFSSSRKQSVELAKLVLSPPHFDDSALKAPSHAKEKAHGLYCSSSISNPQAESLSNAILKFIDSNDDADFHQKFPKFLLEKLYGKAGSASLQQLANIFEHLSKLSIDQPEQTFKPQPTTSVVTLQMKYGHLIPQAPQPQIRTSPVTKSFKEQMPVEKVITPPEKIHLLLDPKFKGHFIAENHPPKSVDESFFDTINDPLLARIVNEHRQDLRAHLDERRDVALTRGEAEELQKELFATKSSITSEKANLKQDLLQDVERFKTPAGTLALRRLVGKGVKPTIEMLISLWRRDDLRSLIDHGMKQIPERELQQMNLRIQHYLEAAIKERHLERAIELVNHYLASNEDSQVRESLYETLTVQRQFDIEDSDGRDLLYLEFAQEIVLRKQQVAIIREMLSDPNAVRQLRMGDGKSKVLLPLLAKRKATGDNLVILMLPEELYETNCRDLERTNRDLFGQSMLRFDFTRSSDRSEKALTRIQEQLLKTIQNKGFVMTTKTSLLSFRNAYLEMLLKLATATPQEQEALITKIRIMSRILVIFAKQGDVLADEIDACLDVRKEVNYSLNESTLLDSRKADIGSELMQIILTEGNDLLELATALQNNTQAAISPERREQLLKRLSAIYLQKHPLAGVTDAEFAAYTLNDLKAVEVEKKIFALKKSDPELFKRLTCVKAFIDRGFHTTLSRVGNVNYGRDPVQGSATIPFKASNTPHIGSEFDDDIEKACFTKQDYLQNGVTTEQISKIITILRNRALTEIRQSDPSQMLSLAETEAGKEFQIFLSAIDPKKTFSTNLNLARMDAQHNIDALTAIINHSPMARLGFCHTQILSKMRQFPAQIHSVATDVADIVHHFGGFTGTPWNLHTYHDKIRAKKNLGVDGSTWALMLERDIPVCSFAFDANKPFDSLLDNLPIIGNAQAVIDTGAYLRGTNNGDFISHCLTKAGDQIKAGIYFDAAGRIVKKQGDKVLPLELAASTNLKDNLTLYDQAHSVGADIAQARDAKAIVTIGENTFIRDLFQAVWRLRQFHRGQRVIFAVSDKIKERILGGEKRALTKEDILKFCLRNEALRETEDNYRAEKEKIQGAGKRASAHAIASLIADDATDSEILRLAEMAQKKQLFIKTRPQEEAYDQYGMLRREESPSVLLEAYKRQEKLHCKELAAAFHKISSKGMLFFGEYIGDILYRELRPATLYPTLVTSGQEEGGSVEVEAQAEMEQQIELCTESETEQELELSVETLIPQVQNGSGGHGLVTPLSVDEIAAAIAGNRNDHKVLRLSDTLEFFDSEIFVSAMFERNFSTKKQVGLCPQMVFYSNRKPVQQVIIAKQDNNWTLLIPSTHEGHGPCRNYFAKASSTTQAVQLFLSPTKPLLMHKTGQDRSDALPFTSPEDREKFYRLYVQAKLFNGEIEYLQEEREVLKNWLQEKGVKKFKTYFEDNILPTKPLSSRNAYRKSTLAKIFSELTAGD